MLDPKNPVKNTVEQPSIKPRVINAECYTCGLKFKTYTWGLPYHKCRGFGGLGDSDYMFFGL